ncbi:TDT family transporter [Dietzia timorensis]|nr:TDT family transporter [Dietzia timorensis]
MILAQFTPRAGAPGANRPLRVPLPPAGPAWFPTVMGTGILSTLIGLLWGDSRAGLAVSSVLLVAAWVLMIGLACGFAKACARDRSVLAGAVREASQRPAWGTVSMGVMSAGSAASTVLPLWSEALSGVALGTDAVLWTAGTVLGLAVAADFARGTGRLGNPTPVWGLTVVAPMVSATAGCAFVPHLGSAAAKVALLGVVAVCFATALVLGAMVFAAAYHHHWRRESLPLALRPSLWIPLGVVGQSTAAIQLIASNVADLLPASARPGVLHAAHLYGIVVLAGIGTAVSAYAAAMTISGFARRMPFGAGWWSLTFPVGTCALGAFYLGRVHGEVGWLHASGVITGVLACTWTLCAVASLTAVALERHA